MRRKPRAAPRQPRAGRPPLRRRAKRDARTPHALPATRQIAAIRKQIETVAAARPPRWNANPEDVRRAVLKLVLTLVELIRQLLERQAIRRMEAGTLTDDQVEDIGRALMKLEETLEDMARRFGMSPDDLNLDLGPIGKLM